MSEPVIQAIWRAPASSIAPDLQTVRNWLLALKQQTLNDFAARRKKAAALLQKCRQRARRKGYAEGLEHGTTRLLKTVSESEELRKRIIAASERDCLHVALSVAEEIIAEKIGDTGGKIAERVRACLMSLAGRQACTLHVAADMHEKMSALLKDMPSVTIVADAALSAGSALVMTPSGSIEFSWRDDFNRAKTSLLNALNLAQSLTDSRELSAS